MTVREALAEIVRHPVQHLVRHWNWKAALLSAVVRGTIFFTANLGAGLPAALRALGLDIPLRLAVAGFYGALVQAFRRVEPAWAATAWSVGIIVALTHGLEFLVHYFGGTPRLGTAMALSIAYSALSAVFNLFLMRRGALVVGTGGASLREDLRRVPALTLEFVREIGRIASQARGAARRRGGRAAAQGQRDTGCERHRSPRGRA